MDIKLIERISGVINKVLLSPSRYTYNREEQNGFSITRNEIMMCFKNSDVEIKVSINSIISQYDMIREYRDCVSEGNTNNLIFIKKLIPDFKLTDIYTPTDFDGINFDDFVFQQTLTQPSYVINQLNFINECKDIFNNIGGVVIFNVDENNINELLDSVDEFFIDRKEILERMSAKQK